MAIKAATKHTSPNVYIRDIETNYIEHIENGNSSLGVVGETVEGPAFQPMNITTWSEYQSFFGGTNPEKYKGSQYPRYELPYIAKSYLTQSKQLKPCRVLGLSGYNAGPAWVITALHYIGDEAYDPDKTYESTSFESVAIAIIRSKGYYSKRETYKKGEDQCKKKIGYDKLHFYVGEMPYASEYQYATHYNPSALWLTKYQNFSKSGSECQTNGRIVPDDTWSGDTLSSTNYGKFTICGVCGENGYGEKNMGKEFFYNVSLNPADNDYIIKVLGTKSHGGSTPIYVESLYDYALHYGINDSTKPFIKINSELTFYDACYGYDMAKIPPVDGILSKDSAALSKSDVGKRFLYIKGTSPENLTYRVYDVVGTKEEEKYVSDETIGDDVDGQVFSVIMDSHVYSVDGDVIPNQISKNKFFYAIFKNEDGDYGDSISQISENEWKETYVDITSFNRKLNYKHIFNNSISVKNSIDNAYYTNTSGQKIYTEKTALLINGSAWDGKLYVPSYIDTNSYTSNKISAKTDAEATTYYRYTRTEYFKTETTKTITKNLNYLSGLTFENSNLIALENPTYIYNEITKKYEFSNLYNKNDVVSNFELSAVTIIVKTTTPQKNYKTVLGTYQNVDNSKIATAKTYTATTDSIDNIGIAKVLSSYTETTYNKRTPTYYFNGSKSSTSTVGMLVHCNYVNPKYVIVTDNDGNEYTGPTTSGSEIKDGFIVPYANLDKFTLNEDKKIISGSVAYAPENLENPYINKVIIKSGVTYDGTKEVEVPVVSGTPTTYGGTGVGVLKNTIKLDNLRYAKLAMSEITTPKSNYAYTNGGFYWDFGNQMLNLNDSTLTVEYSKTLVGKTLNGLNKVTCDLNNYKSQYRFASTPWIVSNVFGDYNNLSVTKLFRFHTIKDGSDTNQLYKISITNILPDNGTFNVVIRDINDTDSSVQVLERFDNCNLDEYSSNYIAYRIGTYDGNYESKSDYVTVELNDNLTNSSYVPCGFIGYPKQSFNGGSFVKDAIVTELTTPIVHSSIFYNLTYDQNVSKTKQYFGLTEKIGVDLDLFNFKGCVSYLDDSNLTKGFHLDARMSEENYDDGHVPTINVDGKTDYIFDAVNCNNDSYSYPNTPIISNESDMDGSIYENVSLRKFTVYFYGGFDGWDIHRDERSNGDEFNISKYRGLYDDITDEGFAFNKLNSNEITSDYYAFLSGYRMFENPYETDINIFATPGIDYVNNKMLVNDVIDMMEEDRQDSIYVVTTPDKPKGAMDYINEMYSSEVAAANLEDSDINTSYACTYYPWVKYEDVDNSQYIYLPPTKDVVRTMAMIDNSGNPWVVPAGMTRGDVECVKAHFSTKLGDEDVLYENRINPIKTFPYNGVKIWGQKTLTTNDTQLNRVGVRRLLLRMKKMIINACINLIFEPNDDEMSSKLTHALSSVLASIKTNGGISDFKIQVENSQDARDNYELPAKIYFKPIHALEYIPIDLILTQEGMKFTN